ncbi:MAG TPA: glucosamine-6-phosphate isomerase [Candidatus Hydrogenedentes bacterium]|jgi:glucosamine-6-phosphate deaminase|nr:glucosamine-6-phosphate isomerase [Candidatus Hydrogenedentota bacterium]
MAVNLMNTIKGSLLEDFFPKGWDLEMWDKCAAVSPKDFAKPEGWWNKQFQLVGCPSLGDFDTMMGHEIATEIRNARDAKKQLILILPVGPMGMYKWAVFFLKEWGVKCNHVHGFNMDEWSDPDGNTLPAKDPGAFQNAMEQAFYGPLNKLTVPVKQRHFATRKELPTYGSQIAALRKRGARLVTVYGIGRVCHIAFWEPHFASEYPSLAQWKAAEYRIAAKLHPLTIEQNALTSFKSRTTLVPATANTVGPGLFLKSDRCIGGADGVLGRGMMWQGLSLRVTLHHPPSPWITSTFMPTRPGRLFYLEELAQPLEPECN